MTLASYGGLMSYVRLGCILLVFWIGGVTSSSATDYAQVKETCAELKKPRPKTSRAPEPGFQDAIPLARRAPKYPFNSLWKEYVCVALRFDVNEKGRTENIEVIEFHPADAPSNFRYKARDAIEKWEYSPATLEGTPVYREGLITVITYELG